MTTATFAVIGGSGLYEIEHLTDIETVDVETPFGKPSASITIGTLEGRRVAFLPRHGKGHVLNPTELPVRANIWALKSIGVRNILSVSAVGSLREEMAPTHLVVPDQLIDRTKSRINSFFEGGIVVHAGFADPFSPELSAIVADAAEASGATVHRGGTLVVMEGPLFSTKAESNLYRSWGASLIGMTALPEAKLAREAEMGYATLACVTDYDVWHPDHDSVTVDMVVATLLKNVARSKEIIKSVVSSPELDRDFAAHSALASSIITNASVIPAETKERYHLLIGKYIS